MSTSTFDQATHALTVIGQQKPDNDTLQFMWPYLTDLVKAANQRTLPLRSDFRCYLALEPKLVAPFQSPLECVTNLLVCGEKHFVPANHLRKGKINEGKIVYVDSTLKALMRGVVERNVSSDYLYVARLVRPVKCSDIDDDVRDRRAYFSDIWESVTYQSRGEKGGALHVDGKDNLFRILVNGGRWLVNAVFDDLFGEDGWRFQAYRTEDSARELNTNGFVLYRNLVSIASAD